MLLLSKNTSHKSISGLLQGYERVQILLQETLLESEKQKEAIKEKIKRDIRISVMVYILLVVITFLLIWTASKYMLKPIYLLQDHAKEISKGNLTVPIKPIKAMNEIDDLYNAFQVMTNYLKHIMSQVHHTSNEITQTSHYIHKSTEQNLAAGEQMTVTSQTIIQDLQNQKLQIEWLQQHNRELLIEQLSFKQQFDTSDLSNQQQMIADHITESVTMLEQLQHNIDVCHKQVKKCFENMEIIGGLGEEQLTTIEEIAEISDKQLAYVDQLRQQLKQFQI